MVLPQNELSDHCKIVTELEEKGMQTESTEDNYNWTNLEPKIVWDASKKDEFIRGLTDSKDLLDNIKMKIEAGLVESTGKDIQHLYQMVAEKVLCNNEIKNRKPRTTKKNGLILNAKD